MKLFRKLLIRFGLFSAFMFTLVACTTYASSQPARSNVSATTAATPHTDKQTVELVTVWDGTEELAALAALRNVYRDKNPRFDIVNGNSWGSGGDTSEWLHAQLRQQQPPDSWQVHAGKESLDYIERGQLEPITKIFQAEGFDRVMPPLLLEQITLKGEIYTVPLNIHRSNVLWYNKKIFNENDLKPPRTLDDFFAVAEKLKSKGITPLAIGGGFELGHLFESILLATYGPEDYVQLLHGDPALWADPRLETAIHTFKQMLDVTNTDRAAVYAWDAALRVLDGKAGMTVMGDWTEGLLKANGGNPNVDFGWVASPGTDDTFVWISDSFGLARGAPHRDAAIAFLKTVGSKDGQDAFNPIKGSIPARTDADRTLYDEYQQWSLDEFRTDQLVPSIAHGAAAPDAFRSAFSRAAIDFSRDLDKKALAEALRDAASELAE